MRTMENENLRVQISDLDNVLYGIDDSRLVYPE